jgi:thioredoxin-like negative regulator of GroEL
VIDEGTATVQALEEEVGSKGLRSVIEALKENDPVVVVVYSPSAEPDSKVLREARAAASDSGAGFVVINGTKEREVRLVAEVFDLRETPATLVVNEGLVVSTKLVGFADRKTVTQAVTNAHLAS